MLDTCHDLEGRPRLRQDTSTEEWSSHLAAIRSAMLHLNQSPAERRAKVFMSDPDPVSDMIMLWRCVGASLASLALDLDAATTDLITHRKSIERAKDRIC
jgi:hypothetical protein